MRKVKFLVLTGLAAVLTVLAMVNAAAACNWWLHQPELPKSLRKY